MRQYPGHKKTLSIYKGAKDHVCARTRVIGCRKSLWAGEIIALEFSEIVDFRATIARANAQINHCGPEYAENRIKKPDPLPESFSKK